MSQPFAAPPPPPPPAQQTASPPRNGAGTTGFVLGLVGLVFSPIPIIGLVAWPLVILGLIFSIIGFSRVRQNQATNRGLSISGIVLSSVGLVVCVLWVIWLGSAFDEITNQINEESNREVVVRYEVYGTATNVIITYSTLGDGVSTNEETASVLPWTKEVRTKGLGKGGTLTVTADAKGGTVNCKVIVDNEESKTGYGEGPFATASCTGF